MALCKLCGADIQWAEKRNGSKIALDARGSHIAGPDRYIFTSESSDAGAQVVIPINETIASYAYSDHKKSCSRLRL